MKKLEKRAFLCLLMAAVLLVGLVFFVVRLELNGAKWSAFYANRHVYTNGRCAWAVFRTAMASCCCNMTRRARITAMTAAYAGQPIMWSVIWAAMWRRRRIPRFAVS